MFDHNDFCHWFIPRDEVIQSFVICDADGIVTDFVSFYTLHITVMNHSKHSTIKAAYSYYNVATTVALEALMLDVLILAKQVIEMYND